MEIYNSLKLRFEHPLWALNPELSLFDTILEKYPEIVKMVSKDVTIGLTQSNYGRKDNPTVEQILRSAIYKEIKQIDYRELEIAMYDSNSFAIFMKIEGRKPFDFSVLQKYISKIKKTSINEIFKKINEIAITEGIETVEKVSPDTTVVKTDIHYPSNNSLVWDCIKTATRLLAKIKKEEKENKKEEEHRINDRKKKAKVLNYEINNTKKSERQKSLFDTYLQILYEIITECIMLAGIEKPSKAIKDLSGLIPVMQKVYNNAYRFQIKGEKVENSEKIFSIYEQHTDIIVKGQREVEFGHKVLITRGTSNMILDYNVEEGNPGDAHLFQPTIDNIIKNYTIIPESVSGDGGFASNGNLNWSKNRGIVNTVFTKVTQSMKNIVKDAVIEKILKKWRSGTEAVISNLKRGFGLQRVIWKGIERFTAKVAWSILGYNLRVFANA
ncbi:MAG: ISNCY family transposase, partial [Candidatus Altarchaeum sp.]|nr:ISNCY family transposase [Candidatus Altarchaeum sp.]